jgi:amino acid transporter
LAFSFSLPIALAIILLIAILVISYRYVIDAYPQGGGAYMVSKENLGMIWGRLAGVSLLIDYTLTVAVSISAGVMAITSAFPSTVNYIVPIALVLVWFMVLMNLRGTSESGTLFALPTYLFIFCMLALVGKGIWDLLMGTHSNMHTLHLSPAITSGLTLFVLLKAFSSGCSAVTGIEAISNTDRTLKPPARKMKKHARYLGYLVSGYFRWCDRTCISIWNRTRPKWPHIRFIYGDGTSLWSRWHVFHHSNRYDAHSYFSCKYEL